MDADFAISLLCKKLTGQCRSSKGLPLLPPFPECSQLVISEEQSSSSISFHLQACVSTLFFWMAE